MTTWWKKACLINSSISLHRIHFDEIASVAAKSLMLTQTGLQITSQVSNAFILGTQDHGKWPSSFVILSQSYCKWAPALIYNIMLYSTTAGCQRGQSQSDRKFSEHVDIFNRRNAYFWPINDLSIIQVHAFQGWKGLLSIFFLEYAVLVILWTLLTRETKM